jgi:hypothetical protein
MDAHFRFFKPKQANGKIDVWPPFEFARKPDWVGEHRVLFQNSTDVAVVFEDLNNALEGSTTSNKYTVPARRSAAYNIADSVEVGEAYEFKVTSPTITTLALTANPEIIIVG